MTDQNLPPTPPDDPMTNPDIPQPPGPGNPEPEPLPTPPDMPDPYPVSDPLPGDQPPTPVRYFAARRLRHRVAAII